MASFAFVAGVLVTTVSSGDVSCYERWVSAARRILLAVALCLAVAGCARASAGPALSFTAPLRRADLGARLAVVGDTQRNPSFLGLGSNDIERRSLLQAIAEASPDLVAFTGDVVYEGASADDWRYFEVLSQPLRDRRVSVVAALGNHEYQGEHGRGEEQFFAHFPLVARRRWYQIAFGPVRLLFLDSVDGELPPGAWEEQRAWYEATLAADDADDDVRGVVVLAHHPPYTNSTVTEDEDHVKRAFVPALLRSRKALAYLSGHVHNYERFMRGGKMFVVSGGGGGPRASLDLGATRRHGDDLYVGPALRAFHFTLYTLTASGLTAEVRGLRAGAFTTMDRFELPFPSRPAPAGHGE